MARVEGRGMTEAELAGPFESFRWSTRAGSYRTGHPRHGAPDYGIIDVGEVRFRAPIFVGPSEARNEVNPLFRLVTDMSGRF